MTRLSAWLDDLAAATRTADAAEEALRTDFARAIATLAAERAQSYRRVNLIRAVADAVASGEDEETAVAHGLAALRARLGWSADSEARTEVLERFAPVCVQAFAGLGEDEAADPAGALAAFEAWYEAERGGSFWALFENWMPETPLVDF